jgi:hypothetical protein
MKFEFKYIVPAHKLDELREEIRPYVELDPFSTERPSNDYTVRSIYYDTAGFDYFWEKVDGYKIRKKIRIRGYNSKEDDDGVFMEIKRKLKEPIEKDREHITFEVMKRLMAGEGAQAYGEYGEEHGVNGAGKFLFHVYRNNLKPVVLVIYEREAYFGRFDPGLRMTIDKNLRCIAYPTLDELYSDERSVAALPGRFIFEVKFREHFPSWLRPITGRLGMVRRSASKYVFCVNALNLTDETRQSAMFRLKHWKGI